MANIDVTDYYSATAPTDFKNSLNDLVNTFNKFDNGSYYSSELTSYLVAAMATVSASLMATSSENTSTSTSSITTYITAGIGVLGKLTSGICDIFSSRYASNIQQKVSFGVTQGFFKSTPVIQADLEAAKKIEEQERILTQDLTQRRHTFRGSRGA